MRKLTAAPVVSRWRAECIGGGPLDGLRRPVAIGADGEPAQLTLEPRRAGGGVYCLTLDWRTGKAVWAWTV